MSKLMSQVVSARLLHVNRTIAFSISQNIIYTFFSTTTELVTIYDSVNNQPQPNNWNLHINLNFACGVGWGKRLKILLISFKLAQPITNI